MRFFWQTIFREESDPFVKMLQNASYGSSFIGAVARLDMEKHLPRVEFIVPGPREDRSDYWKLAMRHLDRLIKALQQTGFQVSAEHQMFAHESKLDVLPTLIIQAHDTVKHWAAELNTQRPHSALGYRPPAPETRTFAPLSVSA